MATFLGQGLRMLGPIRMTTAKRQAKVSRLWVVGLMALWGLAMIIPAALPH